MCWKENKEKMPTYEYECEKCENNFEIFQKMSDEPIKTCPKCGGKVHKVLGNFAISFQGSGFYVNDSKSETAKNAGEGKSCAGKSCSTCSSCSKCEN